LELWFKTDPKERLIVHDRGFPCLKEFYVIRHPLSLRGSGYLIFEIGALPKLKMLMACLVWRGLL
jgi:hypothetical protein